MYAPMPMISSHAHCPEMESLLHRSAYEFSHLLLGVKGLLAVTTLGDTQFSLFSIFCTKKKKKNMFQKRKKKTPKSTGVCVFLK